MRAVTWLACVAIAGACADDEPRDLAATGTASAAGEAGAGGAGASGATSGEAGTAGGGAGEGGASGEGGGSGAGGTAGTTCGVLPFTPTTSCRTCVDTNCCSLGGACDGDPECIALVGCVAACAANVTCTADCLDAGTPRGLGLYLTFTRHCAATKCAKPCFLHSETCGYATTSTDCSDCVSIHCCDIVYGCATDASCTALDVCLYGCSGDVGCISSCRATFPESADLFAAGVACLSRSCKAECGALPGG